MKYTIVITNRYLNDTYITPIEFDTSTIEFKISPLQLSSQSIYYLTKIPQL